MLERFLLTNVSIGKKIALGIVLMLLLIGIVGGIGYYSLSQVSSVMVFNKKISSLQQTSISIKQNGESYRFTILLDNIDEAEKAKNDFSDNINKALTTISEVKSSQIIDDEGKQKLDESEGLITEYKELFDSYLEFENTKATTKQAFIDATDGFNKAMGDETMWLEDVMRDIRISISIFSTFSTTLFISS